MWCVTRSVTALAPLASSLTTPPPETPYAVYAAVISIVIIISALVYLLIKR